MEEKRIEIRLSKKEDLHDLKKWLLEPQILRWFPMKNEREVEASILDWLEYANIGASFTAEINGKVCGMSLLYIRPIKKLAHHSLFAIIVGPEFRGAGIGTIMMKDLMQQAKEKFHIELLHLEVYEGNPAYNLYKRLGFQEYGRHPHFLKESNGKYLTKILMQKEL